MAVKRLLDPRAAGVQAMSGVFSLWASFPATFGLKRYALLGTSVYVVCRLVTPEGMERGDEPIHHYLRDRVGDDFTWGHWAIDFDGVLTDGNVFRPAVEIVTVHRMTYVEEVAGLRLWLE